MIDTTEVNICANSKTIFLLFLIFAFTLNFRKFSNIYWNLLLVMNFSVLFHSKFKFLGKLIKVNIQVIQSLKGKSYSYVTSQGFRYISKITLKIFLDKHYTIIASTFRKFVKNTVYFRFTFYFTIKNCLHGIQCNKCTMSITFKM